MMSSLLIPKHVSLDFELKTCFDEVLLIHNNVAVPATTNVERKTTHQESSEENNIQDLVSEEKKFGE